MQFFAIFFFVAQAFAAFSSVGVGTITPRSMLHVIGSPAGDTINACPSAWCDPANYAATIHQDANTALKYGLLISDRWRNSENYVFTVDGRYTNGTGSIDEDTHNPYFVVRGDGNVGIGTTGPGQALDVRGTIQSATASGASTGAITFGTNSNTVLDSPDGTYLRLNAAAYNKVIVPSGNVGIGTTSPGAPLDVQTTDSNNGKVMADFLQPNMASGSVNYIKFGQSYSNYNEADLAFYYAGVSSTSNAFQIGFYGTGLMMSVRASGNVTMPSQTSFEARLCSNASNAGSAVIWDTVNSNVGNAYNSSNGIFTAPIAGTYEFGFNTLMNFAGGGEYRYEFWKNAGLYDSIIAQKSANTWQTIQGTITTHLNASDTFYVVYNTGTGATYTDCNYNRFWGRLAN